MRDQVLWRKMGRIVAMLAERLDIDAERALDILYNSHTILSTGINRFNPDILTIILDNILHKANK